MTVLNTIILAVMWLAILILHELGHWAAFRRLGIKVVEFGIGLPLPPAVLLVSWKRLPFKLAFSPWLLGAYVQPDPAQEDEVYALPYKDSAWTSGAGVVVNFVIAGVLAALMAGVNGHFWIAAIIALATVALWIGQRLFCAYVIPVLSVFAAGFVTYSLVASMGKAQGVVGLGEWVVTKSFSDVILKAIAFSLGLGILNIIPLFPMDGGRIAEKVISRIAVPSVVKVFRASGSVIVLALLVYSMASDGFSLLK